MARMAASDDWDLAWDTAAPTDRGEDEETLTVPQVGERIQGLLRRGFPRPFWLVGEAVGWDRARAAAANRRSGRHWYFELVDDQAKGDRRASLSVKMWQGTVEKLFGRRGRLRTRLEPADGLVLRALVKPDFYAPRGQLSFTIEDIDPEHTLGILDAQRREVLARLQGEGAHHWNKALVLPDVPLTVGLVTSRGSAAHQDVMKTLEQSGLGIRVLFCDARTQGAETTPSVCAALATLGRRGLDAVLLVRGGGSRLDLSWFDREEIARAVATCPVPVLTGLGHEIDTSVSDAMANTACRTPTAAAEFVVARVRQAADELEGARVDLLDHVRRTLHDQRVWLERAGRDLRQGGLSALRDADVSLAACWREVLDRGAAALTAAQEAVDRGRSRLVSGAHVEHLGRREGALAADAQRLATRADVNLSRADAALDALGERLRLLDPRSVLARGYAYLRRDDGRILMDAATAAPDQALTAVLRDGELDVRVTAARPTDAAASDDPPAGDVPPAD